MVTISNGSPGQIQTSGGWEFVLTLTGLPSTSQYYVEANLFSTQAGTYSDSEYTGQVFGFDAASSSFDYLTTGTNVVSLTVTADNQVNGTFNTLIFGAPPTFTGTALNGTSISGTWAAENSSENGTFIGYMTTTATSVNGTYSTPTITEVVAGNTITEESQYGAGNYPLFGNVGNFAYVEGGSTFWDHSNACAVFTCAIWLDKVTGDLLVVEFSLPGQMNPPYNQVLGILSPVQ